MAHTATVRASEYALVVAPNRIVEAVSYGYLLRVPILMGVLLAGFPLVALGWWTPLLQNLFMVSLRGTVWTTAIALTLGWSIMLTGRLVLLNGKERFGLRQALTVNTLKKRTSLLYWLLAVPIIAAQFTQRSDFNLQAEQIAHRVIAVLGGVLIAYLLTLIGLLVTIQLNPPGLHPAESTFPAPKFIRSYLENMVMNRIAADQKVSQTGQRWREKGHWAGYVDPKSGLPWAGHCMALTFTLATGLLYVGLGLYARIRLGLGESSPVPA